MTAASGGTVSTILYSDNYGGIWTVKADGSGLREVSTVTTGDVTYAPDGIHYAYLTDGSISQLWTASTAGGTSHHLTAAGNNVFSAVWSPNGKWIAYMRPVRQRLRHLPDPVRRRDTATPHVRGSAPLWRIPAGVVAGQHDDRVHPLG